MTRTRTIAIVIAAVLATTAFAGSKQEEQIQALEDRVAALEKSLADMEANFDKKLDAAIQEIANRPQRAEEAYRSILALSNAGKQVEAKAEMATFMKEFSGTEASRKAARLNQELSVVGKPAPAEFKVDKWFQGEGTLVDLAEGGTSLLVFWEEWCPHCKREVPNLEATYEKFKDNGLQIVALTKITKSSTEEKVTSFIEANKLQFPIAKETGEISQYFNVSGIPAAAVVKDGKIIWRGHPSRLNDALIQSWL